MLFAIPQMMVWIDDLERGLQDFLLPLRPPRRIAVARCGRSAAGYGHRGCGAGLRLCRGRAKHRATKHSRRSDQHRASQYRMKANRLLSHRFSSEFFWLEAADRDHSTGATWNWHHLPAGAHQPRRYAILSRSRGRNRWFESTFPPAVSEANF